MLSKRVFGNRSNLANMTLHIEDDHRISLKRASEEPSHLIAPKKSKPEGTKRITRADLKNQENVTKTIERKVKSISLGKPTSVNLAKSALVTAHSSKTVIKSIEKVKNEIKEKEVDMVPVPEAESTFEMEETKEEEVASPKVESPVIDFTNPFSYYSKPQDLPCGIDDYDSKHVLDTYSEPHYAADIFQYYRAKEQETLTSKYLEKQKEITKNMRAILVDWLVEVQQNYTLNHETLYLAVKMVDQYLMKANIKKTDFQLLGATAMLIAAKYDERIPPAIEDFVYSCDNLYKKRDIILMEMDILKKLDFNLGFPLSYRFLRRYARCADLSMEELTLARYILEMSLMDYELIEERESFISAACLLLALRMKHFPSINVWTDALTYYSGYSAEELAPLMIKLNLMISTPPKQALSSIRSKYSHRIFMEVAKISPLPKEIKQ